MRSEASSRVPRVDRDLLAVAVVLGLGGGLLEGVSHLVLQKLNVLDNVWYSIIWIAAVFTGLVAVLVALVLSAILAFVPRLQRARTVAVFLVVYLATAPGIAWMLKEWIHWYSILVVTVAIAAAITGWVGRHDTTARRLFRRGVRWSVALTLLAFAAVEGGSQVTERVATSRLPAADPSTPNILLIIVDALRADHLSSYGYPRPASPAIDRLAAQGTLFEQAFATSSYTLPSHASIVTGLYPYQHGVEWGTSHHWDRHITLPEMLLARGYRTGAFSGNTFWFTREHGFGQGFLHFDDFFQSFADMALRTAYGRLVTRKLRWRLGYEDIPARKHAAGTNAAVLRWLARDSRAPFFVTINYMDVHDPYLPPPPYRNRFASQPNPGGLLNWEVHIPETLTPDQLQGEIDAYDGSIAYVDDQIGALVAALQKRHSDRPLVVVITSDHGEEFGEHGGFLHGGHLYREAIRVPLIVSLPGRVPAGTRVARPVSNASIPATILALLGAAGAPGMAPSLEPLWTDPQTEAAWPLPLAEIRWRPWESLRSPVHYGSMRSLVSPVLHYIDHEKNGPQLYDWVSDPREAKDLARQPDMQPALDRLRGQLPGGPQADRSVIPRRQ